MLVFRRPFPVLHKQFSELEGRITEKIINYHEQIITTVVLQDAPSHNWNDQRSFYEVRHQVNSQGH